MTSSQQEYRNQQILETTKNAINTPLSIMEKSDELLELMNDLIEYGNKSRFICSKKNSSNNRY